MRVNLIIAIFIVVLIFLQYRLWTGSGSIYDLFQQKEVLATQIKENEKLRKQNEELLFQVKLLKKSPDASESRARSELGMIKKNETFYQIVNE